MSRELLDRLGLDVNVNAPVGRLSIGEQQLVELARVLLEGPRLLILDEPNSALNKRETERLFAVLRQLRERGVTMLYVSHRLEEVFAISDRVTVARNGKDVMTRDRAGLAISEVIEAMIGAHHEELFPPRLPPSRAASPHGNKRQGGDRRRARERFLRGALGRDRRPRGTGRRRRLPRCSPSSSARRKRDRAKPCFPMRADCRCSPTEAARRGVCLVPADRKRNGLMLDRSILFNISQVVFGAVEDRFFPCSAGPKRPRARSGKSSACESGRSSPDTLVNHLSGGNQQKVVIGKWLEIAPRVVLLDDPTRGVDVGAKREIYELIRQMSADGRIVLFSSTELPELIGLCDRILVLYRGRLVGELSGEGIDNRTLLHLINTGERPARKEQRRSMTNLNEAGEAPPAANTVAARARQPARRVSAARGDRRPRRALVMIAVIGFAKPRFLNPINLFTILGNTTFQGMLSLGMVFLLAIREIDLSVGWMFNFSAVIAALLMVAGVDPWLAMLAGWPSARCSASSTASSSSARGCRRSS